MIRVHIWLPQGDMFGHASMHCRSTYISWWPEGDGRVASMPAGIRNKMPVTNNIYSATPIRNRGFEDDIRDEERNPETIKLAGLDEEKVLGWWASFGLVLDGQLLYGPLQPWQTLNQNCSTVVAQALKIAGGDTYAGAYNRWSAVWRPKTVLAYTKAIEKGINEKR
ncbi:MAG: hypothetical protein KF746_22365 [Chitinophagaceae bacterium]|nr:hypothetical protein [Chitinophagaceae bacterium]